MTSVNKKRHARRAAVCWTFGFMVPWLAAWLIFGMGWPNMLVGVAYGGFTIGQAFGYRWGMDDRRRIIDQVYGEGWETDAVRAKLHRQIRETAPWN
jgi:hypothetical protein